MKRIVFSILFGLGVFCILVFTFWGLDNIHLILEAGKEVFSVIG